MANRTVVQTLQEPRLVRHDLPSALHVPCAARLQGLGGGATLLLIIWLGVLCSLRCRAPG